MKTIKIITGAIAILTTVLTVLILLGSLHGGEPVIANTAIPACISALFIGFTLLAKEGKRNVLLLALIGYLGLTFLTGALKIIEANTATLHIVVAVVLILATLFTSKNAARS